MISAALSGPPSLTTESKDSCHSSISSGSHAGTCASKSSVIRLPLHVRVVDIKPTLYFATIRVDAEEVIGKRTEEHSIASRDSGIAHIHGKCHFHLRIPTRD